MLQNFSKDIVSALRPLEPVTGPAIWAKHGYRIHSDMIRFWWRPTRVPAQIDALEKRADRRAARAAFDFLMAAQDSSNRHFVELQHKFLRANAAAAALHRRGRHRVRGMAAPLSQDGHVRDARQGLGRPAAEASGGT